MLGVRSGQDFVFFYDWESGFMLHLMLLLASEPDLGECRIARSPNRCCY